MPKFMTDQQKTTDKSFMQRNPWIIIPAILIMGSVLVYNIVDLNAKTESQKWETADFTELVDKCVKKTGDLGVKYPKVTREYCECSTKNIQASLTKKQYIETMDKHPSEQLKVLTPILEDCMGKYSDTMNVLINQ